MIGYYVHHHGAGHATRFALLAARSPVPIVGLGSGPRPAGVAPDHWVELPPDLVDDPRDAEAHGALHWAPLGPRAAARTAALTGWIAEAEPELMVVDVSVEVALAARLCGVPVAYVAQHGRRDDRPHQLADAIAEVLVAPAPAWAPPRAHPRLRCVGAISRFDGLPRPGTAELRRPHVVMLAGAGGHALSREVRGAVATAAIESGARFDAFGFDDRVDGDAIWVALGQATVVVCTAGNNVLAEVAAARVPAIVLPQDRPYDEQHLHAAVLPGRAPCLVVEHPAALGAAQWRELLREAQALDGEAWADYHDGRGADRMLEALTACAPRTVAACA